MMIRKLARGKDEVMGVISMCVITKQLALMHAMLDNFGSANKPPLSLYARKERCQQRCSKRG